MLLRPQTMAIVFLLVSWNAGAQNASTDNSKTKTIIPASKNVVRNVQERLRLLGYQSGPADGAMGSKTVIALKRFQTDHEFPGTGTFDVGTLDALGVLTGPEPSENPTEEHEKAEWDGATEPFSSARMKVFLRRYPTGPHGSTARQIVDDESIIDSIIAAGPGSRFVLPKEATLPLLTISVRENKQRGRTVFGEDRAGVVTCRTDFGNVSFGLPTTISSTRDMGMSGPFMPAGDLSVFLFATTAGNIKGDASDPLRILYSRKYGFVVIGGQGKIFAIKDGALGDVVYDSSAHAN